ncbi:hypothetical protein [Rahnella sp. EDr1-12]|uniref:hypothetical protein n=1 Tax=unclassified Rahnella TaxID=2635087 RepID=UPI003BA9FE94
MKSFKCVLTVSVILSMFLLTGCQKSPIKKAPPQAGQVVTPTKEEIESAQLQQCQKSLDALQTVKAQQSVEYKKNFEKLMKGAAQYSGIRSRIKDETQGTVDALYRYRVSKLCAQIDQALLLGLTESGGSAQ